MDNLQPDFLYDHIQPVRAELFQVCQQSCFNLIVACSSSLFQISFDLNRTHVSREMLKEV